MVYLQSFTLEQLSKVKKMSYSEKYANYSRMKTIKSFWTSVDIIVFNNK